MIIYYQIQNSNFLGILFLLEVQWKILKHLDPYSRLLVHSEDGYHFDMAMIRAFLSSNYNYHNNWIIING